MVFLIGAFVVAGVVGVYYMPQWQAAAPASKSGRRGGGVSTDPVPVLAIAARAADVPVYLNGVGTARALKTVMVRRRSTASSSTSRSPKGRRSRRDSSSPRSIR